MDQEDYYSDSSSSHSSYTYTYSDDTDDGFTSSGRSYSDESEDDASDASEWGDSTSVTNMKKVFADPVATLTDDVDMSRRHLRKQESRYANKNVESVLPMTAHGATNCSELDDFMLIDETSGKEMVGHYVDSRGRPIAEVWESKPPPANADYKSSAPETSNLKLTRLMGFDPHVEPKKRETKAIVNSAERLNGDADLSTNRIAQTSEMTSRSIYFNKKHAQGFSDYDYQRGDMYDGFNDKRKPSERVHMLEPTHRNDTGEFREPGLGHQESGKQIHKVTTKRVEISEPWTRNPHKNGAFTIPSIASLPILPDTFRNNEHKSTPNAHNGAHASFTHSPRNDNEDRLAKNMGIITQQALPDSSNNWSPTIAQASDTTVSQRDNQMNAAPPTDRVEVVSRAPIPQIADTLAPEREHNLPKPQVIDSSTWAAMVKNLDTERDTEDDAEISAHVRSAYANTMTNVTSGATLQVVQVHNEDAPPLSLVTNRTDMPVYRTQVVANTVVNSRSDAKEGTLPGNYAGNVEQRTKEPQSTVHRHEEAEITRTNLAVSHNTAPTLVAASNTFRHGMQLDIIGSGSVPGKGQRVGPDHDLSEGYRQQTSHTAAGYGKEEGAYVQQSTDALGTEREGEALCIKHGAIETSRPQLRLNHNNVSHAREELENEGGRGGHVSFGAGHQFLGEVDRIPILSSATFHVEIGSNSTTGAAHRTKEISRVDTKRTHVSESDPSRAHAAFGTPSLARDIVPMRAMGGKNLGPDRLSSYHPNDRQKIDLAVRSSLSNVPDRSTPIMRSYTSTPIQPHRIEQEVFDETGRDTPNCRLFGRATKLP